jgi:hypothetical protein
MTGIDVYAFTVFLIPSEVEGRTIEMQRHCEERQATKQSSGVTKILDCVVLSSSKGSQ